MICELCHRDIENYTIHHLIPKSREGHAGPRAVLCRGCHRMVHRRFSNRQLADRYNTIEKIRAHPDMVRFLNWIRKLDPHKRIKIN